MEPAEFDKQFIASVEAETKSTVEGFDRMAEGRQAGGRIGRQEGLGRGHQRRHGHSRSIPGLRRSRQRLRVPGPGLHWPKAIRPPPWTSWSAMCTSGGRNPESIKQLAALLTDAGQKKEAAEVLDRLNLHLSRWTPTCTRSSARCGSSRGTPPAPSANSARWWRAAPSILAQAHYDLARAYQPESPARRRPRTNCCPLWKPRPDSGRRRSYCWN